MADEYDRRKWRKVEQRLRISVEDAVALLDGRPVAEDVDRESSPDVVRHRRTGFDSKGRLVTLIYVWRRGNRRPITAWRATREEAKRYFEEYPP